MCLHAAGGRERGVMLLPARVIWPKGARNVPVGSQGTLRDPMRSGRKGAHTLGYSLPYRYYGPVLGCWLHASYHSPFPSCMGAGSARTLGS